MADEKTHYQLLGVEPDATLEQIKENYRELARVFHPDSNFFDEITQDPLTNRQLEMFQLITAAYHVLSNPERRAQYDKTQAPTSFKDWDTKDEDFLASIHQRLKKSRFGSPIPEAEDDESPISDSIVSHSPEENKTKTLWQKISAVTGILRSRK